MNLFGLAIETPTLSQIVTVTLGICANDISWVFWSRRVAQGKALQTGFWASMTWLSSIIVTINVLHNYSLVAIAIVTTAFASGGTVWFDSRKKSETDKESTNSH